MEIDAEKIRFKSIEALLCELPQEGKARDNERIYARRLLNLLFAKPVELCHAESGKPFLKDIDTEISISHTKGFIIVGRSVADSAEPIGIDIEYRSDRVFRVKDKFVSKAEQALAIESDAARSMDFCSFLLIIWCTKEAAFKKLGLDGVDFKEHFQIQSISDNEVVLDVNHPNKKITLNFEYVIDYKYVIVAG